MMNISIRRTEHLRTRKQLWLGKIVRLHQGGHRPRIALRVALLLVLSLLVSACGGSNSGPGGTPTQTAARGGSNVKVYFTKHPNSDTSPTAVFAVTRIATATTTQERATFALAEMLKGPTTQERAQGYYSPFDG